MILKQFLIAPILCVSLFTISILSQGSPTYTLPEFKRNSNIEFPKYIFSKLDKNKYKKTRTFFMEIKTNEKGIVVDANLKNGDFNEAKEIIEIIKKMPKWSPAKKDGKNVSATFVIPLSFD